jgi:hypothetical protein
MTKICKIHRPHIMWLIVLGEDYHDYAHPSFEILIEYLLKKYDITYEDMDVLISTEHIEESDLVLSKVNITKYTSIFYTEELKTECEFGDYFTKEFNINDFTEKLYLKVLPLEEI